MCISATKMKFVCLLMSFLLIAYQTLLTEAFAIVQQSSGLMPDVVFKVLATLFHRRFHLPIMHLDCLFCMSFDSCHYFQANASRFINRSSKDKSGAK